MLAVGPRQCTGPAGHSEAERDVFIRLLSFELGPAPIMSCGHRPGFLIPHKKTASRPNTISWKTNYFKEFTGLLVGFESRQNTKDIQRRKEKIPGRLRRRKPSRNTG